MWGQYGTLLGALHRRRTRLSTGPRISQPGAWGVHVMSALVPSCCSATMEGSSCGGATPSPEDISLEGKLEG